MLTRLQSNTLGLFRARLEGRFQVQEIGIGRNYSVRIPKLPAWLLEGQARKVQRVAFFVSNVFASSLPAHHEQGPSGPARERDPQCANLGLSQRILVHRCFLRVIGFISFRILPVAVGVVELRELNRARQHPNRPLGQSLHISFRTRPPRLQR